MYWYRITNKKETHTINPSLGRGAAAREMAGRGNSEAVGETPTFSFPREGIAHAIALFLIVLISILSSCKPDTIQDGAAQKYFDIKGYFKADTARLRKLNRLTLKTVNHNGAAETKKVHISNWGLELNMFSGSDINKPAWRDSYTIQNNGNTIIYHSKDPELKTREIIINKQAGKIKWILIYNNTKNILYRTSEKLSYFPDSLYIIQKYQKVRLLRANTYYIKGTLN